MGPFVLLTIGISYFISALAVYLRDLAKLVRFTITLLMFLSPVFYSTSSMSPQTQFYLHLNPLTYVIEQTRLCCFEGQALVWMPYVLYSLSSMLLFIAGYCWFNRLKEGFADVL